MHSATQLIAYVSVVSRAHLVCGEELSYLQLEDLELEWVFTVWEVAQVADVRQLAHPLVQHLDVLQESLLLIVRIFGQVNP